MGITPTDERRDRGNAVPEERRRDQRVPAKVPASTTEPADLLKALARVLARQAAADFYRASPAASPQTGTQP